MSGHPPRASPEAPGPPEGLGWPWGSMEGGTSLMDALCPLPPMSTVLPQGATGSNNRLLDYSSGSGSDTRLQRRSDSEDRTAGLTAAAAGANAAAAAPGQPPMPPCGPPPPQQPQQQRGSSDGQRASTRQRSSSAPSSRTASNRRSAARSRMRKLQHVHDLEQRVEEMTQELQAAMPELAELQRRYRAALERNEQLKKQLTAVGKSEPQRQGGLASCTQGAPPPAAPRNPQPAAPGRGAAERAHGASPGRTNAAGKSRSSRRGSSGQSSATAVNTVQGAGAASSPGSSRAPRATTRGTAGTRQPPLEQRLLAEQAGQHAAAPGPAPVLQPPLVVEGKGSGSNAGTPPEQARIKSRQLRSPEGGLSPDMLEMQQLETQLVELQVRQQRQQQLDVAAAAAASAQQQQLQQQAMMALQQQEHMRQAGVQQLPGFSGAAPPPHPPDLLSIMHAALFGTSTVPGPLPMPQMLLGLDAAAKAQFQHMRAAAAAHAAAFHAAANGDMLAAAQLAAAAAMQRSGSLPLSSQQQAQSGQLPDLTRSGSCPSPGAFQRYAEEHSRQQAAHRRLRQEAQQRGGAWEAGATQEQHPYLQPAPQQQQQPSQQQPMAQEQQGGAGLKRANSSAGVPAPKRRSLEVGDSPAHPQRALDPSHPASPVEGPGSLDWRLGPVELYDMASFEQGQSAQFGGHLGAQGLPQLARMSSCGGAPAPPAFTPPQSPGAAGVASGGARGGARHSEHGGLMAASAAMGGGQAAAAVKVEQWAADEEDALVPCYPGHPGGRTYGGLDDPAYAGFNMYG